jgi:hypothetical protein
MKTLVIQELAIMHASAARDSSLARSMTHAEMKRVHGGRAMSVSVDGQPGGTVDDFELEMGIFKGDIKVRVV